MATAQQVSQFRSQFKEFDAPAATDPDVSGSIDIATLFVDSARWWSQTDAAAAILFLAAHYLTIKLMQIASTEFGGTGEVDLYVGMIAIGERRVMIRERQQGRTEQKLSGPGESLLEATSYGQTFLQLRARNVSAIAVV